MRLAVVADIHANLTALEAVLADLRLQSPDLVVQAGDLVGGGSSPAEVVDLVRDLKWPGVYGNTDEMLWKPERLVEALQAPPLRPYRDAALNYTIPATTRALGEDRLAWLKSLPRRWSIDTIAVVHASPDDAWTSPSVAATDDELGGVFGALDRRCVVFGHIHQSFVRQMPELTVVNAGSVSLSYDGDPRAAYAVVDGSTAVIRRVEYDVEQEIVRLAATGDPYAAWTADVLRAGRFLPLP